jgi:hypothetical protein
VPSEMKLIGKQLVTSYSVMRQVAGQIGFRLKDQGCDNVLIGPGLCGVVVRVPGYRSRGLGFDSRRYQIF